MNKGVKKCFLSKKGVFIDVEDVDLKKVNVRRLVKKIYQERKDIKIKVQFFIVDSSRFVCFFFVILLNY